VKLTALDLHKLVADEERDEGVVVRVYGDIERDEHVEEDDGVDYCV
jgi:hypothetical protein